MARWISITIPVADPPGSLAIGEGVYYAGEQLTGRYFYTGTPLAYSGVRLELWDRELVNERGLPVANAVQAIPPPKPVHEVYEIGMSMAGNSESLPMLKVYGDGRKSGGGTVIAKIRVSYDQLVLFIEVTGSATT